jgi:asparagine synthase (glutamine-hydrolysing)
MHPEVSREIDLRALDQIFTFWAPLAPRTILKHVSELPPGHSMTIDERGHRLEAYWRPVYNPALGPLDEDLLVGELLDLLADATRIRLRSDVPVGAYLSGGLDSSVIAALARRVAGERLRTFSVTFDDPEFDERVYQDEVVASLGTEHTRVSCSPGDIARVFPDVICHTERPIVRTAPAPMFLLSKLVHESGYKVVLTGEGADETFGGYDIFKEAKIRRFCAVQPESKWRPLLLKRLYPYLPQFRGQSQSYLEAFFGAQLADSDDPLFSHLPRFRTTAGAKIFFSGDLRRALRGYDALADLREMLPPDFARWHPLSQGQYLETAHLLPGYILSSQGDRMAMAHGVEGRFPFLDHRLVEFAARIPPKLKIRGLREKHILREAMKEMLPAHIGNRTKQPYRAPDCQSFVGAQAPAYVGHRFSGGDIAAAGYFEPSVVAKLAAKCRNQKFIGFRDNMAFVGVLSTQLWHREFVQGATIAADIPYAVA